MALAAVTTFCLLVEVLSATFLVRDFETPNASTQIARNVAERGEYVAQAWYRPFDNQGRIPGEPLKAFQLPGEPLYLAAGFAWLPAGLHRFLHVPVTLLLVTALSIVAFAVGGSRLALTAGTIATLDPFMVVHGPVWDDTFLAAALEWLILAVFVSRLRSPRVSAPNQLPVLLVVALCAGWAALTRMQSQVELGIIALTVIVVQRFRPARPYGWAALCGIIVALCGWGLRNTLVLGAFFLGSSHDGQTLLQANHASARAALIRTGVTQSYADLRLDANVSELDADRLFRDRAITYMRSEPFDALSTASLKIIVSLTGFDFGSPPAGRRNAVAVVSNGLVWGLALWGFRLWRSRRDDPVAPKTFLLLAAGVVGLVTLVMLAIGPAGLRYRISFAPVLYLAAASALQRRFAATPGRVGARR